MFYLPGQVINMLLDWVSAVRTAALGAQVVLNA
jgi:hypothetical protein